MADDSKTEKATPKRRRDERKKGNVLMSKDAVGVVTLAGSLLMVQVMSPIILEHLNSFWNTCFSYIRSGYVGVLSDVLPALFQSFLKAAAISVGPLLLATSLLAIAATFYQTKLLVSSELIKPKFSRLNPLEGIKRLFSLHSLIEALKGILKITILLILIVNYFLNIVMDYADFLDMELAEAGSLLFDDIFTLVLQIVVAFTVIAFFDYLYQWWEYERNLRMSKQEIKEEYKQTEGDPKVKGKIREIQNQRARSRMMQQVPQADVVIRNPTHFAVALRYDANRDNAPVVLAKGMDELALRIVRVAEEHNIATVENVSLARSLYASTELDQEIPPELYGAVAEVLVYVLKLERSQS